MLRLNLHPQSGKLAPLRRACGAARSPAAARTATALSGLIPAALEPLQTQTTDLGWPLALLGLGVAAFLYVRARIRATDERETLQREALQQTMRQAWHEAAPRWSRVATLFAVEATRAQRNIAMDRIDPRMSPLVRGAMECFAVAGFSYAAVNDSVAEAAAWREWDYWRSDTRDADRLPAAAIPLSRAHMYETAGDTLAHWAAPLPINERARLQTTARLAYDRAQAIYKKRGQLADFARVRGKCAVC